MGSKIAPKIGPEMEAAGPKHLLTRPVFEKWPKNDRLKMTEKSCFRGRKMGQKNGRKMGQKLTQNRGRKIASQAQTTLKSKNGPKNRP